MKIRALVILFIYIFLMAILASQPGCKAMLIENLINANTAQEEGGQGPPQEVQLEAPTIDLIIQEGPMFDGNTCFYKIEAVVTGMPAPDLEFSRDDSNGVFGDHTVQVNLKDASDIYILGAHASNSEGQANSSITLSWRCSEAETFEEEAAVYNNQEIEYFFEIAFGSEFGGSLPEIHKWTENIRIKVIGDPTNEDLDSLDQVISELHSLIRTIFFDRVSLSSNIDIYFTSVDKFASIEPDYVPGNMGFFWGWWDETGAIYKGKILIATDGINQQERSHLIREELTQSLGLMNDSCCHEDSIFYQDWTATTNYAR